MQDPQAFLEFFQGFRGVGFSGVHERSKGFIDVAGLFPLNSQAVGQRGQLIVRCQVIMFQLSGQFQATLDPMGESLMRPAAQCVQVIWGLWSFQVVVNKVPCLTLPGLIFKLFPELEEGSISQFSGV